RLFGARPRTNTETRRATGSERRSQPRSRPTKNRAAACRATGACSGHGPEQTRRRAERRGQRGEAGPEVARPKTERQHVGRPAPVRGTAPNKHGDAQSDGVREAKPAPKSPDQKQSGSMSGDRRLFGARPRTNTETRR